MRTIITFIKRYVYPKSLRLRMYHKYLENLEDKILADKRLYTNKEWEVINEMMNEQEEYWRVE